MSNTAKNAKHLIKVNYRGITDKIKKLSEHFKSFKKDKHSTLGLTKSVNKRKKLLAYLKKKNVESYQKVIKQLNLRK